MFAIVDIRGVQYKVRPSDRVFVPRLSEGPGKTVKFDSVLLVADEKKIEIGTPTVKGLAVEAKVLGNARDKKIVVFKKKRRKGYRVRRGHRQEYTEVQITKIG
jgi:large subunit ribosomal protein L21